MLPDRADLLEILRLRLLVCRAAATDSLRWWDDASLTKDGTFLLSRLFPRSARAAARRLALEAARARHEAALGGFSQARHLFDLGAEAEAALQDIPLDEVSVPDAPIEDVETLLRHIGQEVKMGEPAARSHNRSGERVLPVMLRPEEDTRRQQALLLALAYAAGRMGEPVFPVLAEAGTKP